MRISTSRRTSTAVIAAAIAAALLLATPALTAPAAADTAPVDPALPVTVAADPLPTAQMNGVAWTQQVVGGTVYVGGEFTRARPAGSALGSNEVTRSNMLAYTLTTGTLVNGFAPSLNAQVKDLAVSPDQRTLYAVGQFTTVNGQSRNRVAAFDVATGALLSTFRPNVNGTVNAVTVTAQAVYLGGSFTSVNGASRTRVAAVSPANGSTLPFAATIPDGAVHALVAAPDGASVVLGGSFTSLNGSANPGYGLARLNATTGSPVALPVNGAIRNGGTNAAILTLESDGQNFYGTGYTFGGGGNLEGSFAAGWGTGALVWVEDCHGDTYSAFPAGDAVYSASHKHYCGNNGGFPQTTPWTFQRGTAVSKAATRVNTQDYNGYPDHRGRPSPTMLTWSPDINAGTYTGKSQGPWSVSGSGQYVLYGGEFTRVEGAAQQGLVRFAVPASAPNKRGPSSSLLQLKATSDAAGSVRLTWHSTRDPDNETLTYALHRASTTSPAIHQSTVTTTFWRWQPMTFQDTGLSPGSSQRYQVIVQDKYGNRGASGWVAVTVRGDGQASAYGRTVLNDAPSAYWRMGETSGTTIGDSTGFYPATASTGVTRGAAGALSGDTDKATTFSGTTAGYAGSVLVGNAPEAVSVEAWVKTTTTRGGKIVGFGNRATGTSGIGDRHLYMDNAGRLFFGMQSGSLQTVNSPGAYNNGAWHHVVGTFGGGTMRLYVDGVQVAQRTDVAFQRAYWGYWRIGGDRLDGWPSRPLSDYLAGTLDEIAVYNRVLPATTISAHNTAGRSGTVTNQPPVASFTASASGLTATVNASASADPDGTITGYAWAFGDGSTATGVTASRTYAAAGTYTVTLTVTDDKGATGTTTRQVTASTGQTPTASAQDAFGRTVSNGWGTADVGGAWTTTGTASQFSVDGQRGRHTLTAGATLQSALAGVSSTSTDTTLTVTTDKVTTGSGAFIHVIGRRVTGADYYGARLRLQPDGTVQLHATRGNGSVVSGGIVTGMTYAAGDSFNVRVQVQGTNPTAVRAKIWKAGQPEPTTWWTQMSDTTATLQTAGGVGLGAFLFGTATNAPIVFSYDDLRSVPVG